MKISFCFGMIIMALIFWAFKAFMKSNKNEGYQPTDKLDTIPPKELLSPESPYYSEPIFPESQFISENDNIKLPK